MDLDKKDFQIIETLKLNAKLTTHEISRKLRIPITTIHNRIKKLESEGIIKGYSVVLDNDKLGKEILAYVLVTVNYALPSGAKISQEELAKRVRKLEEVESVSIVTGETDMIVKVRVRNIAQLNSFILKKLRNLEGIDKVVTMIVLSDL